MMLVVAFFLAIYAAFLVYQIWRVIVISSEPNIMFNPKAMCFARAWKLLLKGKKLRRKAWISGIYIYVKPSGLKHPKNSFVLIGGLGCAHTKWRPYIVDFSECDWEVIT